MFHLNETGCNSHVSYTKIATYILHHVHTHSYVNAGSKHTLACFYQTHFSGVNKLEVKEKVVCYIYANVEEKSNNGGITVCSFKLNVIHNWVWSNYHGTQQQLHARRDD